MKIPYKLAICLLFSLLVLSSCIQGYPSLSEISSVDSLSESHKSTQPFTEFVPSIQTTEIPTVESKNLIEDASESLMKIVNIPQIEFGYANIDGTKIIVLYDHELEDNKLLTHFKYALGENGNSYKIKYDTYQERNAADSTGRQTMWNFDNEQGCIYTVIEATAEPNDTYMLLTQEEYEKIVIFQELEKSRAKDDLNELKVKCEKTANRDVKDCWKLSEYQNGFKTSMIVFENIGNDLLAWLVLENGDNFKYCEFPATYDGSSGWSIEDNGELKENYFFILCSIQNEQSIDVYLGWYDFEGNVVFKVEFFTDQMPNKKIVCGRYTYPE